jgi:hypothetical protein
MTAKPKKTSIQYAYANGFRAPKGLAAETVAKELERIRGRRGQLTSEGIVEEAANEKSPIHKAFEWDNSKAAHQYRLDQARTLTRAVVVLKSPELEPVKAYTLTVHEAGVTEYVPTQIVIQNKEMLSYSINRAISDLLSAAGRIEQLLESAAPDEELQKKLQRVKRSIEIALDAAHKL